MFRKITSYDIVTSFFVVSFFQCTDVFFILEKSLKPYHIYIFVFFFILIFRKKILVLLNFFTYFYIFIFFHSLFFTFSLSPLFFSYLFSFVTFISVWSLSRNFVYEDWLHIFRSSAIILSIFVWIKIIINYDSIVHFILNGYNHPLLPDIFLGGGVNLESSLLSIFSPAFYDLKKRKYLYFLSCFCVGLLYGSRAGIIILLFSLLLLFKNKFQLLKFLFVVFLVCITISLYSDAFEFFFRRYKNFFSDSGSQGRFMMWQYLIDLFCSHPFGVGIGNSMRELISFSGIDFYENNLHNLYFQYFIELGFIGGSSFVFFCIFTLVKNRNIIQSNAIIQMIILVLFACFFEFQGVSDVLLTLIFSSYFQQKYKGKLLKLTSC